MQRCPWRVVNALELIIHKMLQQASKNTVKSVSRARESGGASGRGVISQCLKPFFFFSPSRFLLLLTEMAVVGLKDKGTVGHTSSEWHYLNIGCKICGSPVPRLSCHASSLSTWKSNHPLANKSDCGCLVQILGVPVGDYVSAMPVWLLLLLGNIFSQKLLAFVVISLWKT